MVELDELILGPILLVLVLVGVVFEGAPFVSLLDFLCRCPFINPQDLIIILALSSGERH